LVAVGWAKLTNLVPLLVSVWFVQRKVLKYVGWSRIFLPFFTILASFGMAMLGVAAWGDPRLPTVLLLGTASTIGLMLAFFATAGMYRILKVAFGVTV